MGLSHKIPIEIRYSFVSQEALAKLLRAVENRHSGQAKRDPESRIFKRFRLSPE